MGIYAQVLWNASQGRGLASTLLMENTNHLAEHFAPVLWPLALLYQAVPISCDARCASAVLPRRQRRPGVSLGSAHPGTCTSRVAGASHVPGDPSTLAHRISEFHPVVLAALPSAVAAYGVFTGRARLALIGIVFCLMFEEETTFVVRGWVCAGSCCRRRRWRFGAGMFAAATGLGDTSWPS